MKQSIYERLKAISPQPAFLIRGYVPGEARTAAPRGVPESLWEMCGSGEMRLSAQVSSELGVSLRQLQWWDQQGIVSPIQMKHRRLYSLSDRRRLALIVNLKRAGMSLFLIRRLVRRQNLVAWLAEDGTDDALVTNGRKVEFVMFATVGYRMMVVQQTWSGRIFVVERPKIV